MIRTWKVCVDRSNADSNQGAQVVDHFHHVVNGLLCLTRAISDSGSNCEIWVNFVFNCEIWVNFDQVLKMRHSNTASSYIDLSIPDLLRKCLTVPFWTIFVS